MKAISIWQPWAWAILTCGKDVENRSWETKYRGSLLIHASKRKPTKIELRYFAVLLDSIKGEREATELMRRGLESLPRGGIVGQVNLVGCHRHSRSPWSMIDSYHWILEDPKQLPFQAYKGERGLFEVGDRKLCKTDGDESGKVKTTGTR